MAEEEKLRLAMEKLTANIAKIHETSQNIKQQATKKREQAQEEEASR